MTNSFESRLQAVDQALLTPLVQRALASETARLLDWSYAPIEGGFSATYGIYRFQGQAQVADQIKPWSLILKATGAAAGGSHEPTAVDYWKREVLVYQSGLLDHLPPNFVAPRCFGIAEYPGEEFWLWLEAIDETEPVWALEQYGSAALHLGHFNGLTLATRPLPTFPWLMTKRLQPRLARATPGMAELRALGVHPAFEGLFPGDSIERILRLWGERERLLTALDRLPRCLCHYDTVRQNLMIRHSAAGQVETVALDWAALGIGVVGEEIATLFAVSPRFFAVDITRFAELDQTIFTAYLAGLREAGWQGDAQQARFGYAANAAFDVGVLQVGIMVPRVVKMVEAAAQRGEEPPALLGPGRAQLAALQVYLLDLGDEGLAMLDNGAFS